MPLTASDRAQLAEACYLAAEYLDTKMEMYPDYEPEDVESMEREQAQYHELAARLAREDF